jgi:hypothetical protein
MENELIASKDFYLLSVDIFKILSLERGTRMVNGKVYLDETYQTYCKLIENSNIVSEEMRNMIKPTPRLLSDVKKDVGNELFVTKRTCKKEEEEEKERENEEENLEKDNLEKENIMISELEENNKEVLEGEEKEALEGEEKEVFEEEEKVLEEEKVEVPVKIEEKIKRKYTKKKVPPSV